MHNPKEWKKREDGKGKNKIGNLICNDEKGRR